MNNVVLYIAQSLDGFIAKPDGSIDWLTSVPYPELGDYGYAALLESIGTTIMGRKTYDEVIGFGIEWPYVGYDTFVVTKDKNFKLRSPDTYLLNDNLEDFIAELKQKAKKDIWLVGGGELITTFINHELLDKMIITIVPKVIGEGIPLFGGKTNETEWKLTSTQLFDTGLINLTYERLKPIENTVPDSFKEQSLDH